MTAAAARQKLGVDEMNLPQVGHCGIPPHTRPVLHRGAQMGIPLDPEPCDKPNGIARLFAEAVGPPARDRDDHAVAVRGLYRTTH